MKQQFIC